MIFFQPEKNKNNLQNLLKKLQIKKNKKVLTALQKMLNFIIQMH